MARSLNIVSSELLQRLRSSQGTPMPINVLIVASLLLLAVLVAIVPIKTGVATAQSFVRFFYASFVKPHTGDGKGDQQSALESFYKAQAEIYDTTRAWLLRGREEMLALVAAQLRVQARNGQLSPGRSIWVDIGGGTGWNIEAMQKYVDVPTFFSEVYLVDLSPSLCQVARQRFARLGWDNVQVVCEDARLFSLGGAQAELITMSYSLSMMPNFHVFVDAAAALLAPKGIIGVVDFYVQSSVETIGRTYLGGSMHRHVGWLGRTFWRAWFDLDRVGLEGARRDYLEYRFGTISGIDERNYLLGGYSGIWIPYYIFIGCLMSSTNARKDLERLNADYTESPYLSPGQHLLDVSRRNAEEVTSKAYHSAIVNLSAKLPLPSTFYQNFRYRIYYEEHLAKHTQFGNDFIYAFTWEDSRVDQRLLKIGQDDVILCLSSAGDNLLDYLATSRPRRIHAVDLNPNQGHLLELKVAAYQALDYNEFWKLFGEGRCPGFRDLLLNRLSPYLSSQALQFWVNRASIFTSKSGLYEYGGSGHATRLVRLLLFVTGKRGIARKFCAAKTLNEQRELWPQLRHIILNRFLHYCFVGTTFLWRAAGVPAAQAQMIIDDYRQTTRRVTAKERSLALSKPSTEESALPVTPETTIAQPSSKAAAASSEPTAVTQPLQSIPVPSIDNGEAIWSYVCNTLDPVARDTLISEDNFYYLLTLNGSYTKRCHPAYLSARAHAKLSRSGAFDGLRIHTDEINEVIARIKSRTLTIAVIMDSMDWFDPCSTAAAVQVRALNKALRLGGRVLLRSAGLHPWYISIFEQHGFHARQAGARTAGACIDRVNMYASTWVLTKQVDLGSEPASTVALEKLEI